MRVACLPKAGIENPYQKLMMDGLSSNEKLNVFHGVDNKIFGLLLTAIKYRPDYIHVDWLHQYYWRREVWMTYILYPLFLLQVLLVKYIFGVSLVWTLHNIMPHDSKSSGPYIWARRFFAHHVAWIRVFSSSTVSKATKILKVEESKFLVIPEGSYVDYYPNSTNKEESLKFLGWDNTKKVMLFFGSLRPYKGIENLIEAFIDSSLLDWRLMITGMCRDLSYLDVLNKKNTSNRITIKGEMIDAQHIQYYMNAADVVVLPFKKIENSGSAILAMGFGKAVLAPNIGVLPFRLCQQKELLYDDEILDGLSLLSNISIKKLENIGRKNLAQLNNNKWSDFEQAFV